MKKLLAASSLLFASSAIAAGTPTLTGKWSIHNSIAGNEGDQSCMLVQAENKLTGTCTSQDKGVQIIGSVDGNKVTWKYGSDYNGSPLTLIYTATPDDSSKITGNVEAQPFGVSDDFTATPSKEAGK